MPDPGVPTPPSASMEPWQASLLGGKQDRISNPSQFPTFSPHIKQLQVSGRSRKNILKQHVRGVLDICLWALCKISGQEESGEVSMAAQYGVCRKVNNLLMLKGQV